MSEGQLVVVRWSLQGSDEGMWELSEITTKALSVGQNELVGQFKNVTSDLIDVGEGF